MCMYSLPVVVYSLGFYAQSRQLGTHKHFYVYSHEALNRISVLLCILMACEKTGTASFLGYPVILLLLQRYSIAASFVKTVISFPATNTRIVCIYMASRSVVLVAE